MNIDTILKQLDNMYNNGQFALADDYLSKQYEAAIASGDDALALGIANEQLGYYRVAGKDEQALLVISSAKALIGKMHLQDTIEEGTTLLNIATAYRAMGKYAEASESYFRVEKIYKDKLAADDYRVAGLYNNMSLLSMEQGEIEQAIVCLNQALFIMEKDKENIIELAITHTNLGQAYCKLGDFDKALAELNLSEDIFFQADVLDEHFSACAAAKGYAYLKKQDYDKSIKYYEKALVHVYRSYGMTGNYKSIQKDLQTVLLLQGNKEYKSMLDVCQDFYETYGKPMIHEKFAKYEQEIAVGLCGEGSECFALDDKISLDHDCGPGFSMWVTQEIYDLIGTSLQEEYNKLPIVFAGYIRLSTTQGQERTGVCTIDRFYARILGGKPPRTDEDYRRVDETALATAVNGRIFADPKGMFSQIRGKLLAYYPHTVWIEKLSKELIYAAQTGQYNYGRAMARGEFVTAQLVLAEYMKSIMHVIYLLNKTYMPYYKWQHKRLYQMPILPEVAYIFEAISDMPSQREAWQDYTYNNAPNPSDMVAQTIEIIARLVVNTLLELGLTTSDDLYLEKQGYEVIKNMQEKDKLIEQIVELEWYEFDMVKNEGGRASCQEDFATFSIMRKSQYLTWTTAMLHEYLWHMDDSLRKGRNLIAEKYGRMMESTSKEKYDKIKDQFPTHSEQRIQIMEQIIDIQVAWMEAFAKEYPGLARNARSIHTSEDTQDNTSYETYLRGELGTYSEELMKLYGEFIVSLAKNNKNLAYLTMENTVKLYGYNSLEDAERKM